MISEFKAQAFLKTGLTWMVLVIALFALLVTSLWSFKVSGFQVSDLLAGDSDEQGSAPASRMASQTGPLHTRSGAGSDAGTLPVPRITDQSTGESEALSAATGMAVSGGDQDTESQASGGLVQEQAADTVDSTDDSTDLALTDTDEPVASEPAVEEIVPVKQASETEPSVPEDELVAQVLMAIDETADDASKTDPDLTDEAPVNTDVVDSEQSAAVTGIVEEAPAAGSEQVDAPDTKPLIDSVEVVDAGTDEVIKDAIQIDTGSDNATQELADETLSEPVDTKESMQEPTLDDELQIAVNAADELLNSETPDELPGNDSAAQGNPGEPDEALIENSDNQPSEPTLKADLQETDQAVETVPGPEEPGAQAEASADELLPERLSTGQDDVIASTGGELVALDLEETEPGDSPEVPGDSSAADVDPLAQSALAEAEEEPVPLEDEPVAGDAAVRLVFQPASEESAAPLAEIDNAESVAEVDSDFTSDVTDSLLGNDPDDADISSIQERVTVLEPNLEVITETDDEPVVLAYAGQAVAEAPVVTTDEPLNTGRQAAYRQRREEELAILRGQSARIIFNPGSAEVTRELETPLDSIFDPLFLYAEMPVEVAVSVNEFPGTTDDYTLSLNRGNSVVEYLVNRGLEEERFSVVVIPGEQLPDGSHRVTITTKDPGQ